MNNHMLVRREWFNDSSAKLETWWELYEYRKNWLGRWNWRPTRIWSEAGDIGPEHGDRKWADKIAKHYGIEVPEPPK